MHTMTRYESDDNIAMINNDMITQQLTFDTFDALFSFINDDYDDIAYCIYDDVSHTLYLITVKYNHIEKYTNIDTQQYTYIRDAYTEYNESCK